jgi:hypothetical protein
MTFFARKTFSQRKKGKKERRSSQTAFHFRGKCCGEQGPPDKGRWCRISSRRDALNRFKERKLPGLYFTPLFCPFDLGNFF